MVQDNIILIDNEDNIIGYDKKLTVHREGKLHRAFSILIFNSKGELLIQKRAYDKYHSGGLWSNSCCSHPRVEENMDLAIHRRLYEELGFDCELKKIFSFSYYINFDNGIIENELDHVFVGNYDGEVNPNFIEICDWKWISIDDLKADLKNDSRNYSHWFKIILERLF